MLIGGGYINKQIGKKEILIIGLTGPIGAGCTNLAEHMIQLGRLGAPEKWVAQYLKEIEKEISSIKVANPKDEYERMLKVRELKEKLLERDYLYALKRARKLNIKRISMSELIVKLCFEDIDNAKDWAQANIYRINIYEELKKHFETVKEGINILNGDWYTLGDKEHEQVDNMLSILAKTTQYIKELEVKAIANDTEEIFILQQLGNNIRKSGSPFNDQCSRNIDHLQLLAREASNLLEYFRHLNDKQQKSDFIIDAFRNPSEVDYFRKHYGQFFLISVNAKKSIRQNRFVEGLKTRYLIDKHKGETVFKLVDQQDSGEETYSSNNLHVQGVSECSYLSDIAITNNYEDSHNDELFRTFLRCIALILEPGCTQPTQEETMMSLAYSLSLRSACISRQVGAVITDSEGYVLGQGWNDCGHGQISCGLISVHDYLNASTDFYLEPYTETVKSLDFTGNKPFNNVCFKDLMSKAELCRKSIKLSGNLGLTPGTNLYDLGLRIKRLEYCRALHAEENALLQAARRGGMGVQDGTIYTTTFPCELCAKKIKQTGINEIVYTEPYPDSISEHVFLKDGSKLPNMKQFAGVKFASYSKLFKARLNKKERQSFTS